MYTNLLKSCVKSLTEMQNYEELDHLSIPLKEMITDHFKNIQSNKNLIRIDKETKYKLYPDGTLHNHFDVFLCQVNALEVPVIEDKPKKKRNLSNIQLSDPPYEYKKIQHYLYQYRVEVEKKKYKHSYIPFKELANAYQLIKDDQIDLSLQEQLLFKIMSKQMFPEGSISYKEKRNQEPIEQTWKTIYSILYPSDKEIQDMYEFVIQNRSLLNHKRYSIRDDIRNELANMIRKCNEVQVLIKTTRTHTLSGPPLDPRRDFRTFFKGLQKLKKVVNQDSICYRTLVAKGFIF